ncbi:hypothetical protein M3231_08595 [Neobacillus mesonae]|nr:hypothetical protein [Neobacillus mesonae]
MIETSDIVIGIDGGGSFTRVTAADLNGNILSQVRQGGTNRYHNIDAEAHLKSGIIEVLEATGRETQNVVSVTAALAGIDKPGDEEWAKDVLLELGTSSNLQVVNDTLAAHRSIFLGRPGIVAIGGTGSLIFGINEEGKMVRNDNFNHYAHVAARFLSYETVYAIIARYYDDSDLPLVQQVLEHVGCTSVNALAECALKGYGLDKRGQNRMLGDMASLITEAAGLGIPLAQRVCNEAARQVAVGIRLIAASFQSSEISVSFSGSCITSPYMKEAAFSQLGCQNQQRTNTLSFSYVEQLLPSDIGAVLMAYEAAGIRTTKQMLMRLGQHFNIGELEI